MPFKTLGIVHPLFYKWDSRDIASSRDLHGGWLMAELDSFLSFYNELSRDQHPSNCSQQSSKKEGNRTTVRGTSFSSLSL